MTGVAALTETAIALVLIRRLALVTLGFGGWITRVVFLAVLDQLLGILREEIALGAHQRVVVEGQLERADLEWTAPLRQRRHIIPAALIERCGDRRCAHQHQHLVLGHARFELIHDFLVQQITLLHIGCVDDMAAGEGKRQHGENQQGDQLLHACCVQDREGDG